MLAPSPSPTGDCVHVSVCLCVEQFCSGRTALYTVYTVFKAPSLDLCGVLSNPQSGDSDTRERSLIIRFLGSRPLLKKLTRRKGSSRFDMRASLAFFCGGTRVIQLHGKYFNSDVKTDINTTSSFATCYGILVDLFSFPGEHRAERSALALLEGGRLFPSCFP